MLPRSKRLPKTAMNQPGRRFSFAYGSLKEVHTPGVAVVISKKTLKTSVARHRAKRRILAVAAGWLKKESMRGGVVVYPNAQIEKASQHELEEALRRALALL